MLGIAVITKARSTLRFSNFKAANVFIYLVLVFVPYGSLPQSNKDMHIRLIAAVNWPSL